jgi:hypothetical protein
MHKRTLWLAGIACLAALALIGLPVRITRADCGPGTAGNDLITCDDDPDGVNALTGSDTITVQPGATVNGPLLTVDGGDTITNDGTVAINGALSAGIGANGDGNTITNNGTLSAAGNTTFGAVVNGDGNDVTNNGSVDVSSANGVGLWVIGDGNTVTNNGAVATSGSDAEGIYTQGSNTVVNNGTIATSGPADSEGIAAYDGDNTVINNGTITTTDPAAAGIDTSVNSGNDTVINRGDITTGGAAAIQTGAGNDSVTIAGGNVSGLIDGGADTDSLNFDLELGADGFEAVAAQLAAANPNGGSLTIGGATYTWTNFEELLNLLRLASIGDGRLNGLDFAATAVVYCAPGGGLDVYAVTAGGGEMAFHVDPATAVSGVLGDALGVSLTAQGDGSLLLAGPSGYTFAFDGGVCGVVG